MDKKTLKKAAIIGASVAGAGLLVYMVYRFGYRKANTKWINDFWKSSIKVTDSNSTEVGSIIAEMLEKELASGSQIDYVATAFHSY